MTKYIAIDVKNQGFYKLRKDSGKSVKEAIGNFQINHRKNPLFVLTDDEYNRAVKRTNKVFLELIKKR